MIISRDGGNIINYQIGIKVSLITIVINICLFVVKLVIGIIGHSKGMVADAIHTLSDIFTTLLVIVSIKISSKAPDEHHQYGHEKFEAIIVKIMSAMLILAGGIICYNAVKSIINVSVMIPSQLSLVIAFVSIVVKEAMFIITLTAAKKINNQAMVADAYHHHLDGLSSVGVFIGILGTRLKWWYLDAIGGIIVSLMIIYLGLKFYFEAIQNLVDRRANLDIETKILQIALTIDGVVNVKKIKTRLFGNKIYSDLYIEVSPQISVDDALKITTEVHDKIEEQLLEIKHCEVILK